MHFISFSDGEDVYVFILEELLSEELWVVALRFAFFSEKCQSTFAVQNV